MDISGPLPDLQNGHHYENDLQNLRHDLMYNLRCLRIVRPLILSTRTFKAIFATAMAALDGASRFRQLSDCCLAGPVVSDAKIEDLGFGGSKFWMTKVGRKRHKFGQNAFGMRSNTF